VDEWLEYFVTHHTARATSNENKKGIRLLISSMGSPTRIHINNGAAGSWTGIMQLREND
jgi:hypothetical protein